MGVKGYQIDAVTADSAGVMTPELKAKLDSIQAGAQVNQTAEEIAAAFDGLLGGTDWRNGGQVNQTAEEIAAALDGFLGGTDWRAASVGADGKSAYELAVKNGFAGTEAEWLLSLKGAKGDKGATGDVTPEARAALAATVAARAGTSALFAAALAAVATVNGV